MSILLFFIFFKSICLHLQNLVLRVHIRLFGPNVANSYYSTAYHYLKGNPTPNPTGGLIRPRTHHPVQRQARRKRQQLNSQEDYYNLKLNHSRSVIRQQQQIYLQRRSEGSTRPGTSTSNRGGEVYQFRTEHERDEQECLSVGAIKDDKLTTTPTNHREQEDFEPNRNLVRRKVAKKCVLDSNFLD